MDRHTNCLLRDPTNPSLTLSPTGSEQSAQPSATLSLTSNLLSARLLCCLFQACSQLASV